MQPFSQLDELARKLSALVPEPVRHIQEDMEKNMRGLLESGLQKMNLVTREEFDIQTAVLQRTRQKLEIMEQRLAKLEADAIPYPAPKPTVAGPIPPELD